jgi:hypothetical protein
MNFDPIYQPPQDTLKKTLPMVVPAGRVEEFFIFTEPASGLDEKTPVPSAEKQVKTLSKLESDTPKVVKPPKQQLVNEPPKPVVALKKPVQNAETLELREVPLENIDPAYFKFLSDSSRPILNFSLLKVEAPEKKAEAKEEFPLVDYAPSVFTSHELPVKDFMPLPLAEKGNDGIVLSFLVVLGVFSVIRVAYYKRAKQYLSAFFNMRMNSQMLREEKSANEQMYSFMLIASILVISTFLFQLFNYYGISLPSLGFMDNTFQFFKIVVLVILAIFLKILLVKVTGFIFNTGRLASDYIFNRVLFFNFLGLLLFPVCIILQYNQILPTYFVFMAGGVIAIFTFLFMFQRSFILGNSESGTSSYYLFLYLCTLEILPLIVFIKLFINLI